MTEDTFDWGLFSAPTGAAQVTNATDDKLVSLLPKEAKTPVSTYRNMPRRQLGKVVSDMFWDTANMGLVHSISRESVEKALTVIKQPCHSTDDYFRLFSGLNLLNAAIKAPEWKDTLSYSTIKGRVGGFIHRYALDPDRYPGIKASYSKEDRVAYVKIYGVLFSFHYIPLDDVIMAFAETPSNEELVWDGSRLQMIAEKLFEIGESIATATDMLPNRTKHNIGQRPSTHYYSNANTYNSARQRLSM